MSFDAIRVSLLAILATAGMAAQSNDAATALGAALSAAQESRTALGSCDLIRARAQYELAARLMQRAPAESLVAQSLAVQMTALEKDLDSIERRVDATQSQLSVLIERQRWTPAEALLNSSEVGVCPAFYSSFRDIVANSRKPKYGGPGFWPRFRSGFQISAIVAGIATAGVITIDQVAKR